MAKKKSKLAPPDGRIQSVLTGVAKILTPLVPVALAIIELLQHNQIH
jgi:hypothetical protein